MRTLAAVAVLLLVAACQTATPEMTEAEIAEVEANALAWSDQWLETATNLDAEGTAALMDRDDGHSVQQGTVYRPTWAEILAGRREMNAPFTNWVAEWDERRVDVLGPDVALVTGQATGSVTDTDGREYGVLTRLAFVVRSVSGEWKGLYAHAATAAIPIE